MPHVNRVAALLLVIIASGCSPSPDPLLAKTRLKVHPVITGGSMIEKGALLLTLDAAGAIYKDGQPARLEDVASLKRTDTYRDLDPVILEVHPSLTFKQCTDFLNALIGRALKGNVSFLVSTPNGPRAVTLPVSRDLPHLSFITGRIAYDEGDKRPDEQRHLWLSMRVGESGTLRVGSILRRRYDEVWFKDLDSPGAADPRLWKGDHPVLGKWPEDQLRTFLSEKRIQELSPLLDLEVHPGDRIEDFLRCLDTLHRVAPGRVVVSLKLHE